jgi:predicted MPP superfamily phosphohydrolase
MSGAKDTKWMVDHINDAAPDAIAFVGDVGDQPVNDYLREKLEPLNNLNAEDGIFITFGNHENMNRIEGIVNQYFSRITLLHE